MSRHTAGRPLRKSLRLRFAVNGTSLTSAEATTSGAGRRARHHLCRCVFFFLFLLKKQQHLQREKGRGGEAFNGAGGETRAQKMTAPGAGRRLGSLHVQSFQEITLKLKPALLCTTGPVRSLVLASEVLQL